MPSTPERSSPTLLVRLRGVRPSLSPAEDRVAARVLADPRAASALTISELATAAETSETTVLRFCRRLGLRGYPQLRLALAEAATGRAPAGPPPSDIDAQDSVDDIVTKVSFADARAVEDTAAVLDRDALADAARVVAAAGRVDVYGMGASALVGMDLQQKLHRIGVVAFSWNDPHIALTSATLLGPGDVAIGISHSGTTTETIEALTLAGRRGATTVAVTTFPLSRLAVQADHVLVTAAQESSLRSGATASRIAALTVVDCLYITVAQHHLGRALSAVERTREAVAGHHVGHSLTSLTRENGEK